MSFGIQAPPLAQNITETMPATDSAKDTKTKEAAHKAGLDFEAILVRQMLSKAKIGGEGAYGDMATEALASAISKGGGLGLGRVIENQLAPHQAGTTAASASPAEAAKAFKKATGIKPAGI